MTNQRTDEGLFTSCFFFILLDQKLLALLMQDVSVSKLAFYHEEKLKNNVVISVTNLVLVARYRKYLIWQ